MKKTIIGFLGLAMFLISHNALASVTWNTASNDCRSIAVADYTTSTGISDPCWPLSSVYAKPGDSINIRIYYHNTGTEPATNVRVILNAPTVDNLSNTHTFNGQILSDQGSISFGPVSVNLTSPQKLTFGSTRWYANQTQYHNGFLFGQDGSELIANGLQIGTINQGWASQGSVVASFYVNKPNPTGTLTAYKSSCSISAGQSSCTIPFSWTTSDPVGISSVTRDGGQTVGNGNTGSTSFTVPYPGATFKLYNNNLELDSESVTSACATGTNWNGSICEKIPPTGTLTAANPSCVISTGQSSCSIQFTWNTVNPVGSSSVTRDGGSTVATGNSGTNYFSVPYPGTTFRLYNSTIELDTESVTATCASGTTWNNSICALPPKDCEITSFSANPTESSPNSMVSLTWTTNNCKSVNISNTTYGTNLSPNGSRTVWPTATTSYVLTGVGETSVSPTRTVEVIVGSPAGAPGFPAGAPGFGA